MKADAIPYENFKEKIKITSEEISKDRYVEVWPDIKVIYSCEKWRGTRCTS